MEGFDVLLVAAETNWYQFGRTALLPRTGLVAALPGGADGVVGVRAIDYTVDVLQAQRYEYGTSADEGERELRDDANRLAKRTKTCSEHLTGGSIDQITQAQCLLKVGKARVRSLS